MLPFFGLLSSSNGRYDTTYIEKNKLDDLLFLSLHGNISIGDSYKLTLGERKYLINRIIKLKEDDTKKEDNKTVDNRLPIVKALTKKTPSVNKDKKQVKNVKLKDQ